MANILIGVAIDTYEDKLIDDLKNCVSDTSKILSLLEEKFDFENSILISEKEQTTKSNLFEKLKNQFLNALPNDNIFLVFMGHGVFVEDLGKGYWQVFESKYNDPTTWFDLTDLQAFSNKSKAKHICIIIDSCYSGALFEMNRGGGLQSLSSKKSRNLLTSGGMERVKDGPKGGKSPFTTAIVKTIEELTNDRISFSTFSEEVIKNFPGELKQTPQKGVLLNSGDEGGAFYLESNKAKSLHSEIKLDLNLELPFKIEFEALIPTFYKNTDFDFEFVNSFVRQKGYFIIAEIRKYLWEEKDRLESLEKVALKSINDTLDNPCDDVPEVFKKHLDSLDIPSENQGLFDSKALKSNELLEVDCLYDVNLGYNIVRFDKTYLSIEISCGTYLGGAHPNDTFHCMNFGFKPDRILEIRDLFEVGMNFNKFMMSLIDEFCLDIEQKETLESYVEYLTDENTVFTFDNEFVYFNMSNLMPRVVQAYSEFKVPIVKTKLI